MVQPMLSTALELKTHTPVLFKYKKVSFPPKEHLSLFRIDLFNGTQLLRPPTETDSIKTLSATYALIAQERALDA